MEHRGPVVLIERKQNALGVTALGLLWWVVMLTGLFLFLRPDRTYHPQGIALLLASLLILLVWDLLHTAVKIDPKKGRVTTWRGHLVPWGRKQFPLAEVEHIELDTRREIHKVRQDALRSRKFRIDVVTISLVTRSGQSIVVEQSSLQSILQEQLLAVSRAVPAAVLGKQVPLVSLKRVWVRRLLRRGAPGLLLVLVGLMLGAGQALQVVAKVNVDQPLPGMVVTALLTLGGAWLVWSGSILPRSLRRTARPGEQPVVRFPIVGLALLLSVATWTLQAGAVMARQIAGEVQREAVKSPGLDQLDRQQVARIMKAWGFEPGEQCAPDLWDGCIGSWQKQRLTTTVSLVDLAQRAREQPARAYQLSTDWMIEVTVKGAPRSEAVTLLTALAAARDEGAIEAALRARGYSRLKSESRYPDLMTTAEHGVQTVKVVVRATHLSIYPREHYATSRSRLLLVLGAAGREMLPVLEGTR